MDAPGRFCPFGSFLLTPDKANLSVRKGRKEADLIYSKMAELPKDEPTVDSAFSIVY